MALQMRYEACYVHVMQVVKFLINPSTAEGDAGQVEREARMSIADRSQARKVILQVNNKCNAFQPSSQPQSPEGQTLWPLSPMEDCPLTSQCS